MGVKINPGVFQPQMKFTAANPVNQGYGTTYYSFGYAYSSGITTNTYSNGANYVTPDLSTASSWRILFPNCPAGICSYPSDNFVIGRAAPTSGTPSFSDFFVVNWLGNIGMGTTAPTSKLHILSGTDSATTLLHLDTGVHGGAAFAVGGTANNEASFDLSVYRGGQYSSRLGVNSAGNVYLQPSAGYVGIGTTNPLKALDVIGDINASGTISGANVKAKYQDMAEWVESSQALGAGTVVVLDHTKSNQVIASSEAYDTRVAGVISLHPGFDAW